MTVRTVHNTRGEYVAFVSSGHLFTPDTRWLGIVVDDRVYNTQGFLVGILSPDDRLARDWSLGPSKQVLPPRSPMRPPRPLRPNQRLFMPAFRYPLEDVFQGIRRPLTAIPSILQLQQLPSLGGASIIAHDGTFLGLVSSDVEDERSIANPFSEWGDPTATESIFNPNGPYGSFDSELSPFHPTTGTPPRLERDGETIGSLTVNPNFRGRIDPNAMVSWLAAR